MKIKINRIAELNSVLLLIETYGIFMTIFSPAFQSVIFKKSFFSGLGTVIILLQILVSFLNIFFIAIFFKKEILEFLKKNNLDKIIIITGIIVLILPINFFIKICLFCSIYVLVEFMQIISRTRKKQDNNSIIIILLSTILGLFLIISFFTNSLI